ncbi:MAG: RNA recognition motif-containing protein [Pycnora praestabilis]|nr:MAG: RNA recognition motif-containing protein [Pycnora praestabilis]
MAPQQKKQLLSDGIEDEKSFEQEDSEKGKEDDVHKKPHPREKGLQQRRSLFVRSLPASATTASLTEHFSQSYPLKHATVVLDPLTKQSKGYGFVTFADAEDADCAKEEFNGAIFEGRKIKVEIAEPRKREIDSSNSTDGQRKNIKSAATVEAKAERLREKVEARQPPKLIVRNLPWSVKDPEQLAVLFRSYGKVKQATIPNKKPGLMAGFGFVVLRGRKNAEKALEGVNGKEIDGRTLAVDWAVKKDVWDGLQSEGNDADQSTIDNSSSGPTSGLDSIPKPDEADDVETVDEGLSSAGSEIDEEDQDELEMNSEIGESSNQYKSRVQSNSSTLFVRNLPFTTTDDSLQRLFSQFGPIRYARTVMDFVTERPKGTGFVCFYNIPDADLCLREAPRSQRIPSKLGGMKKNDASAHLVKHSVLENENADPSGRYTIDGRVLQVSRAVDRNEAARLMEAGTSIRDARDKDKRRLYLLSEGTVPSNSPLYAVLAPSEVKMRETSAKQRKALIQSNPTLHLSLTRLSIRNIPRSVTSKELKALAREGVVGFAKDVKGGVRQQLSKEELERGGVDMKEAEKARKAKGKGIVKQAKIVFEGREGSKVSEESGAGRSRGYGFVEYVSHRWALMGLRWLNGHAIGQPAKPDSIRSAAKEDIRERKKRLIVEFAIENAQVVGRRQERESKARERSKVVLEKMAKGELPEAGKKPLTKDALMAKTRKGMKRKRDAEEPPSGRSKTQFSKEISTNQHGDVGGPTGKESLAKRQRIVAKKRMMRRSKKSGART